MRWIRWLASTVIVVALGWGGYWVVATHALSRAATDCGNEVLREATSIDRQLTATVFERSCGATSPFTRIVSVRRAGSRFDGENRDEWVFVIQGRPEIRLMWPSAEKLAVAYDGGGGHIARQ